MNQSSFRARLRAAVSVAALARLGMLPALIALNRAGHALWAALLIALSALAGGWTKLRARRGIAEHPLDGAADRLTQAALILSAVSRYKWTLGLIVLFAAREGLRAASRHVSDARPSNAARILDFIAAAALYVVSAVLMLFPSVSQTAGNILLALCALALAASCAPYLRLPARPHPARPALRGGRAALHAALLCVWAAVILVCLHYRDRITVDGIVNLTPSNSFLAALVLLALFAVKSVTVVIYGALLYAASGILFPLPAALAVNLLGSIIMITIPYLIGSASGAETVRRIEEKHPKAALLRDFRAQNDWMFALIVRVLGPLPGDLIGAYMGAAGVRYPHYVLGSLLGMLPSMLTFSVMGGSVGDAGSARFIVSAILQAALSVGSILACLIYCKKHLPARRKENA